MKQRTWSVLKLIKSGNIRSELGKFGCILLNLHEKSTKQFESFNHLWYNASLRIAVDGSANFLAKNRIIHTAHIVCGDFDSVDPKLIETLRCSGRDTNRMLPKEAKPLEANINLPQVIETPNQKETDFTKAVWVAMKKRPDIETHFVLFHADGSRVDHIFGLINTLHLIRKDLILVSVRSNTISWLLAPGLHHINKYPGAELCSLVPFTGPAKASTQGLEYNLKPQNPLSFGGLISTSNLCRADSENIIIETDRELLWSIDL